MTAVLAHERRWRLAAIAAVVILVIFLGLLLRIGIRLGQDATIVTDAAQRVAAGAPLYDDPLVANFGPDQDHYYGPPALAALYAPFSGLPDGVVAVGSLIAAYMLAGAAVVVVLRSRARGRARTGIAAADNAAGAAALIGLCACDVLLAGAILGNPSMLLLPLLAIAFAGLQRDRPWLVALGIGTAAALRVYPIALLVPLAIAGRWREIGAIAVVIAGWVALGIAFAGTATTVAYIDTALALLRIPSPESIVTNASPAAFVAHLGAPAGLVSIIRTASIGAALAMLVGGGLALRSLDPGRRLAGLGLGAAGMTLASGAVWDHYLAVLVLAVLALVRLTGHARWGLLSAALISGQLGGGFALVWLPAIVAWRLWRRPSRLDPNGRPVAFG